MRIDPADAAADKSGPLDQFHHFAVTGDEDRWQAVQIKSDVAALPQTSAKQQLAHDKRMREDLAKLDALDDFGRR